MDDGLRNEGQGRKSRIVVVYSKDVGCVDGVKGINGSDGGGAEKPNRVEKVTDYVLLGEPTVFKVIVKRAVEGSNFLKNHLSGLCRGSSLNWDYQILCTFEEEIYGFHQAENDRRKLSIYTVKPIFISATWKN